MERMLGIDFGTKRIGLALSDESGSFAFPHSVIQNDKRTLQSIKELCQSENLERIILGLPKGFDGQETAMTKKVEEFGSALGKEGLIFEFEPEIMSSKQASHAAGSKDTIDASAAAIILQSYLDRRKNTMVG